jgi:hypothetical protein
MMVVVPRMGEDKDSMAEAGSHVWDARGHNHDDHDVRG